MEEVLTKGDRRRWPLAAAIALLALCGCSGYSGKYLGEVGGKRAAATGIPITLPKPIYRLTRSQATDESKRAVYSLVVEYVPDPRHRYDVALAPGLFADPNWAINLQPTGVPSSAKAGVTETLTPTINAIGSFAGNLLGALATGFFEIESSKQTVIKWLGAGGPLCTQPRDTPAFTSPAPSTIGDTLIGRLETFRDDAAARSGFFWLTDAERACLDSVLANNRSQSDFLKEKPKYLKQYSGEDDKIFVKVIEEFMANIDKAKSVSDVQDDFDTKMSKFIEDAKDPQKRKARDKLKSEAASDIGNNIAPGATEFLENVIKLEVQARRGRYVLYLERLTERVRLAIAGTASPPPRTLLDDLERRRAEAVGVPEFHVRKIALQAWLAAVRDKDVEGGRAPAAPEYATYRQEFEAAQKEITSRRDALVASLTPPTPPFEVLKDEPVEVRDDAFVTGTNHKDPKAPAFVLVLEEVK